MPISCWTAFTTSDHRPSQLVPFPTRLMAKNVDAIMFRALIQSPNSAMVVPGSGTAFGAASGGVIVSSSASSRMMHLSGKFVYRSRHPPVYCTPGSGPVGVSQDVIRPRVHLGKT